jgi:transcriptional regulator
VHRVAAFEVASPEPLLVELLRSTAATLVWSGPSGLASTLLPMTFVPRDGGRPGAAGSLTGHVARTNPVVHEGHGGPALVVVTGVQGYVSPSWYPSKAVHGRVVPTWDYVTVQARGELVLHDDPAWLRAQVAALTDRHEAGSAEPWSVDDAPEDHVASLLRSIVGVEVVVTELVAKAKLSQNRPVEDVAGVVAALRSLGGDAAVALAEAVERANEGRA